MAPPLWVLVAALLLNLSGAPISKPFLHGTLVTGQLLMLMVPLSMGLLVSASGMRRPEVITAVALRSLFGLAVGTVLVWAFGFSGSAAAIALIGSAAPIGFTAVVLSSRENLDLDLAASAAAISVFLGSLWIPLACSSFRVESSARAGVRVSSMYTASAAILEALVEAGVEYLFANFGSDHPGLIEAIAEARAANRPGIAAAAGGAHAETVRNVGELAPALERALRAVRVEKRAAVIDVHIT